MKITHLVLLVLSGFAMPLARAQDLAAAAAFLEKRFQQLDVDRDGRLSADEARPVEIWVKGADVDKDGLLSREEVTGHLRNRMGELLAARKAVHQRHRKKSMTWRRPPWNSPHPRSSLRS